jgi:hypothetical protein
MGFANFIPPVILAGFDFQTKSPEDYFSYSDINNIP